MIQDLCLNTVIFKLFIHRRISPISFPFLNNYIFSLFFVPIVLFYSIARARGKLNFLSKQVLLSWCYPSIWYFLTFYLKQLLVSAGVLVPLKYDNCYLARTDPRDVARTESRTFLSTEVQWLKGKKKIFLRKNMQKTFR